jgi:hypothetical protein
MAIAAKFVQPILIFLAYLITLDVDVVRIRGTKIMGWGGDVRYCFAMAILVILLLSFFLSFFLSSVKSLSDTFLGDP